MTAQAQTFRRLDPHFIYAFDALGSLALGIALLVTATPLTALAGWSVPAGFLWTIGLLLVPWSGYNLWIARTPRPDRAAIVANIAADIIWVTGSAGLIAVYATSLSQIGLVLLTGQAIAVAGVLALKLAGARALA